MRARRWWGRLRHARSGVSTWLATTSGFTNVSREPSTLIRAADWAGSMRASCRSRRTRHAASLAASSRRRPMASRPAASTRAMMAGAFAKSVVEKPSRSGLSCASEARTFCSIRMPTIFMDTPNSDWRASRFSSFEPTLTAITRSAPIARTTSTGRLRTSPPLSSRRPSTSSGVTTPGIDMLARIAFHSSPWLSTTISPVSMSVATAR